MCADPPTYLPSNAVVTGAGACAPAGIANAKMAAVKSALASPDMLPPFAMF
jgi:hypothetical protein